MSPEQLQEIIKTALQQSLEQQGASASTELIASLIAGGFVALIAVVALMGRRIASDYQKAAEARDTQISLKADKSDLKELEAQVDRQGRELTKLESMVRDLCHEIKGLADKIGDMKHNSESYAITRAQHSECLARIEVKVQSHDNQIKELWHKKADKAEA